MRSVNEKIIDSKFHRLAILRIDERLFDDYYNLAIISLRQSLADYYRNGHNRDFDNSFSYRQISIQMELLSRLCIRLSDSRLEELLDITINIYKSQKNTPRIGFYDRIGVLFKRISYSISQNKLLEKLDDLLNLPIPTANYFTVPITEHFPEPFEYIDFKDNFQIPKGYNRRSWDNQISNLIQIAKTGTPDERRRSLLRLVRVFKIGGLNAAEIEEFKNALWYKVDPISELPIDTGYLNFVLLGLPELNPGDVKNKYRKWLLSQPIPSSITRSMGQDGKMHDSMKGGGGQLTVFIYEWIYSSVRLQIETTGGERGNIEWSETELLTLFNKISSKWEEQKAWLSEFKEKDSYFYPYLLEQFKEILILFEQTLLFKLDKITDQNDVEQILKTFGEFSRYDICTNSAIPGILLVKPGESPKVVNQLRYGLFSPNSEVSKKSIEGFYNYGILANNKKVPPMDEIIISDFVYSIVLRKEPGLSYALEIASQLIREYPELFKEQHIEDLLQSLKNLISPLKRDEKKIQLSVQDEEIQISDIEFEAIQRNAIELGNSLQQYLIIAGKPIPDFLKNVFDMSPKH